MNIENDYAFRGLRGELDELRWQLGGVRVEICQAERELARCQAEEAKLLEAVAMTERALRRVAA